MSSLPPTQTFRPFAPNAQATPLPGAPVAPTIVTQSVPDGLIVPVIHDAQDLSVEGLAKRIKDIARRARSNELTPDEVSGGTFTITNPGPFGSLMATPVINLPQVGILDTEAVVKRPVVVTILIVGTNGKLVIEPLPVTK